MFKRILTIILWLFFGTAFVDAFAADNGRVVLYTGATSFHWLSKLQTEPENYQNWDSNSPQSNIHILYPQKDKPDELMIQSLNNNHSLRLADLTSISFDADGVEAPSYLGLYHQNLSESDNDINMVVTLEDGSKKQFIVKSAKQNKRAFAGFIADKTVPIKQLDIASAGDVAIDDLQWGSFADDKPENTEENKTKIKEELTLDNDNPEQKDVCNLKPQVVQLQCDDNQWLFDVKVTGNQSRSAWWCSDDDDEQCASYNEMVSYGYYPKQSRKKIDLVFTDQENPSCSTTLHVSLPTNCKDKCYYRKEDGVQLEICEGKNGNLVTKVLESEQLSMILGVN